jgi:hypothetical protein
MVVADKSSYHSIVNVFVESLASNTFAPLEQAAAFIQKIKDWSTNPISSGCSDMVDEAVLKPK